MGLSTVITCHLHTLFIPLESAAESQLKGTNQSDGDRCPQREKMISLCLDDRNVFTIKIDLSCKIKEVMDMKIEGHLIWLCHNSPDNWEVQWAIKYIN